MKATIKKINKQHSVLVDVILNHSDELHENSNIELERYQIENK